MKNAINWFEIPVRDFDNAIRFYEGVLGRKLIRESFGGAPHAMFPCDKEAVTGSLIKRDATHAPGGTGAVIYLDCADLAAAVAAAPGLGGAVVTPVTPIAPHGTIAVLRDPDGNHVGLHTPPTKA